MKTELENIAATIAREYGISAAMALVAAVEIAQDHLENGHKVTYGTLAIEKLASWETKKL